MVDLSQDQRAAVAEVDAWFHNRPDQRTLTLGGYAGTGKTTVIRDLLERLSVPTKVCAFTGKAVYVLRTKGVEAQTLHNLMYRPSDACTSCDAWSDTCASNNTVARQLRGKDPTAEQSQRYPVCPALSMTTRFAPTPSLGNLELIIVDEASMLSRRLADDLESYGKKILYVGDHGQLEPIGEDAQLMVDPEIRLERIHRQAKESGVLRLAHSFREGLQPEYAGRLVDDDVSLRRGVPDDVATYDVVLCGFNKTRVAVNRKIRKLRGYDNPLPEPSERVICLRNDTELGIFNGMQATVLEVSTKRGELQMKIVDDLGTEFGPFPIDAHQFGAEKTSRDGDRDIALFDFGYCMTTHKSQGSEWNRVCVLEQIMPLWSADRWRYTAVTRAAKHVTYCMPGDR